MSEKKWALLKNQGDPQKDTNETRTHSNQQMSKRGLTLREKQISQNASKAK